MNLSNIRQTAQPKLECQHDRHMMVVIRAGHGAKGALFCLSGRVEICRHCKKFLTGDKGSQYLYGQSLIVVNSKGSAVHDRTVPDKERQRLVQRSQFQNHKREPFPAWDLGEEASV